MPPSATTRSRLGLDVVPNAFKPTSEPSCSAAVPQLLGRRARVFSGLNWHHESHRHIAFSGSGLELGSGRYQPAQPRLYLHVEPAVARSTASGPLFAKASVICRQCLELSI